MGASGSSPANEQQPYSVEKRIFVASSSVDLALAQELSAFLSGLDGVVRGECWKDRFPLGLLTFEALEQMLQTCVGAVFVASQQPNNNVMIELGLVAGRMGRSRVAIYTVGNVDLPTDLAGISASSGVDSETSCLPASRTKLLKGPSFHIIESGLRPVEIDLPDELIPTWIVKWEFRPCASHPGAMTVNYLTEVPDSWTEATGIAFREYGASVSKFCDSVGFRGLGRKRWLETCQSRSGAQFGAQ